MLPEITVFAGPNGSGKSTITKMTNITSKYINADDIKAATHCTDLEAAIKAEDMREECLRLKQNFTFETVLSTPRNLDLLKRAKGSGYFIRCIYVLTADPEINKTRVQARKANGGHDVPSEKITTRYNRALTLLPEILEVCDIVHVYDNSLNAPFRIFKKRKDKFFAAENEMWAFEQIRALTGIDDFADFPL